MRFTERHPQLQVFELTTDELNQEGRMQAMLDYFQLGRKSRPILLDGAKNKNEIATEISEIELAESRDLLRRVPDHQLERLGACRT